MIAVERVNPSLIGDLPKECGRAALYAVMPGELPDLRAVVPCTDILKMVSADQGKANSTQKQQKSINDRPMV